jgi:hypothetical protein
MFLHSNFGLGATFCIPACNFEWGFVHLSSRSTVRVGRLIKRSELSEIFGNYVGLCEQG